MSLGQNIKKYRVVAGLTQKELAEKVGLGQSMLSRIECGGADTTVGNIVNIAKVLQCTASNLLEGLDEEEEECRTA